MENLLEYAVAGITAAFFGVCAIIKVLWKAREDDSKEMRELTGRVGHLEGRQEGITELSDRVISEIHALNNKGD